MHQPRRWTAQPAFATDGRALSIVDVGEGGRDVATRVQDAPHVDTVGKLDIEDEVRETWKWPAPNVGGVELVGKTQGTVVWMSSDMCQRPLEGADEARSDVGACISERVVDGGIDVVGGEPA